ncbi:MAG TPA: cadmium resistance transporter [Allocoleopsis sp.]
MLTPITAIPTGVTAFTATNLDDIVILLLFFSQVNAWFRRRHIVTGQYLGFAALVLASLPGFFGGIWLPRPWIGLLGIVPIAIGVSRLLNREEDEADNEPGLDQTDAASPLAGFLSPQTYGVASITFANGGDNIGIYVPLFASCTWENLVIILSVFFLLVGVWCYTAYRLTQIPTIAQSLSRYGSYLIPFILIGLGIMILVDSHTLEDRGLLFISAIVGGIAWFALNRNNSIPEVEKNL